MQTLDLTALLLLLILSFASCKEEKKDQIARLVKEWQGKQIMFPENPIFTSYLTDTTDFQILQSAYKVLVYVDSIGCTCCKLQLNKWKELIAYTDSVTGSKVPFLFFFHPKDYKEIKFLLKLDGFEWSVCIDTNDRLNKQNRFPADMKNTGENPLVTVDVSGCITATYDKQSAKPGETLRVGIRMTPKDPGSFDETVTIKCNTNQPLKVQARGTSGNRMKGSLLHKSQNRRSKLPGHPWKGACMPVT